MRQSSIAGRLFASAAVWSAIVLFIAGIVLSTIYRRTTMAAFDARLNVYLKELVADLAAPGEEEKTDVGNLGEPRFQLQGSGWYWQILKADGTQVKVSRSLFGQRLPTLGDAVPLEAFEPWKRGYITGPDERRLRVIERPIDLGEDGQFIINVAAESDEIERDIAEFQLALGLTFLLLGIALTGSTVLQVRYGLKPLTQLRSNVSAVREGQRSHIEGSYPEDIAPLASELNLLIDTNREILERARTQVGNLAHALKTPLSVMSNEADASGGAHAQKMAEQVALMRHQIDYYLNRARAAALAGALGAVTDVPPVLEGLMRAFSKIHRTVDFDFSVEGEAAPRFRGEKQDLEEMVGNLVDNAGKWAKAQVQVTVESFVREERPMLAFTIDDDGPGLPPEKRAEMGKRGVRLDESKPGTGLGFSIVKDLSSMYGGRVSLDAAPLGGLRVRLELPGV